MTVTSSFWVSVDPANPGQFFACCGLLELADRLWPGAEGWFASEGTVFHITCGPNSLQQLLASLADARAESVTAFSPSGLAIPEIWRPLRIVFRTTPVAEIQLDAWVTIALDKGVAVARPNSPWNFWSGQQKPFGIWTALQQEFRRQLMSLTADKLSDVFALKLFQEKGRFGFDAGPAWNSLDVGFSPNEQGIEVESSPAIELLAAIGLQRLRPKMNDNRSEFSYQTWDTAVSVEIAAATAAGGFDVGRSRRFFGTVVQRGQFAALGRARAFSGGELG